LINAVAVFVFKKNFTYLKREKKSKKMKNDFFLFFFYFQKFTFYFTL